MEEGRRGGCNGVAGRRGFPAAGWGEGGVAFPARGWVSTGKSPLPPLWNAVVFARIIAWAPTSSHSSPRRWAQQLSWERCSAPRLTQLGSTDWHVRWLQSSKWVPAGKKGKVSSRGRKVRGVGGFSGVTGVLPMWTTIVGGKKKFNRTVPSELVYWSDSSIGPPV